MPKTDGRSIQPLQAGKPLSIPHALRYAAAAGAAEQPVPALRLNQSRKKFPPDLRATAGIFADDGRTDTLAVAFIMRLANRPALNLWHPG